GGAQPHLVLVAADVQPARAPFDEEGTDAARAGLAGARPDDDHARLVARSDPLLAAVDHVLVPVAARGGPQRARVGAGVRLGEPEARGREAPGGDLRDVSLLLLLRAELADGLG